MLGEEHPDTLDSAYSLTWVLARKDDPKSLAESEVLYRNTLEPYKRYLGKEGRYTLGFMSNLANLLQRKVTEGDAKSLQEAETLYRSVEIRKGYSKRRQGTLASMDDLISF